MELVRKLLCLHDHMDFKNIPRVHYTSFALSSSHSTDDEPKLSVALMSSERGYWLQKIMEEFETNLRLKP